MSCFNPNIYRFNAYALKTFRNTYDFTCGVINVENKKAIHDPCLWQPQLVIPIVYALRRNCNTPWARARWTADSLWQQHKCVPMITERASASVVRERSRGRWPRRPRRWQRSCPSCEGNVSPIVQTFQLTCRTDDKRNTVLLVCVSADDYD